MSSGRKTLEEKVNQLPASNRAVVVNFLEYLFDKNANDPNFLPDLDEACRRAFDRYSQPYYNTWQDLQQAVLFRFWRWLPGYRGEAKRREVLYRIAINELIAAAREQSAKVRYLKETKLDQPPEIRVLSSDETRDADCERTGRKLTQNWAGGLGEYSNKYTSLELQKKALEWRDD
ncbi:MAG TPA: hypothetical protein VLL54_16855 [Pyrinomonadaceae bacterium]|nr:hypothetical protein [Pyrinomonadaceae bacterium]